MASARLSATNLAVHHHLNCDLYIHNVYHRKTRPYDAQDPSELAKANFERGLDWEQACLFPFLDRENLLLTVPPAPVDADILSANIEADDRDHFFVAGVAFWPPPELEQRFIDVGEYPVTFGLAKPDLLEITRTPNGVRWRVIDAKASMAVKTSHHVQIYFYTLCLSYLLPQPFFQPAGSAAVWLPPAEGFDSDSIPSFDDLKSINTSLLAPSLDDFLFHRLPRILSLPRESVDWHYNPLCRGCSFKSDCEKRTVEDGELGTIPNISLAQVKTIRTLLGISRGTESSGSVTDIEDLHLLLADGNKLDAIKESYPSTLKKANRILAVQRNSRASPVVEAARTKTVQIIPRRNFTCPRREDIAVVISLVVDPSSSKRGIASFCISVFSSIPSFQPDPIHGNEANLCGTLSSLLRRILSFNAAVRPIPLTQFYVFSSAEQAALQAHLIDGALASANDDLRLCIGALAQGASLLQTTFQPLLLSGALLEFMGKGRRPKAELQTCLERMNLLISGTAEELRQRIQDEIRRLQTEGGRGAGGDDRRTELGQLPRVVVLRNEVESLLALPVPGSWDLAQCAFTLLPPSSTDRKCPDDEDVFNTYKNSGSPEVLEDKLEQRNSSIYAVLQDMRTRIASSGSKLLVNDARTLTANFMDVCKDDHLRKLFFMQQFEVLAKLSELWKARIQGCPDAPVLEYKETVPGAKGVAHVFYLLSGALDIPTRDKDKSFYDYIMTEDETDPDEIPVEALYDDLSVSGLPFPLNRYSKPKWETQNPIIQRKLLVADLRDIAVDGQRTKVTLQTWGGWSVRLVPGRHYRLSPRLVDFNINKVLPTLLELDMRTIEERVDVPFLQLILNPRSFGDDPEFAEQGKELVKVENTIQSMFRTLRGLDDLESAAGALVLKPSQHRAVQRILSSRLSVLWGPPGTGKTYTIALALLRLLEVQHRLGDTKRKIIFITAMTHAAIEAVLSKLSYLKDCYNSINSLPTQWLAKIQIEHVLKGADHPPPSKSDPSASLLYAGTVYQLYNFSKRHPDFQVDCAVIDEAGQLALSSAALVLRSLSPTGRIVIAGDSEQLAPILTAEYPQLKSRLLFGSILDCLMHLSKLPGPHHNDSDPPLSPTLSDYSGVSSSQGTVIQLTENFRLNPDLGEFVSTIYSRAFKPQKVQAKQLAMELKLIERDKRKDLGVEPGVLRDVQNFLLALSDVMLRKPQTVLGPPPITLARASPTTIVAPDLLTPTPISLALVRLQTESSRPEGVGYEAHVRGEAALAAALITSIRRCSPGEDIFVATPHRIQRQAVKAALEQVRLSELVNGLAGLELEPSSGSTRAGTVTVDTVERLQGSEAAFVICLFSLPPSASADLGFLLERRRLNVAISRAKTLCILVASPTVLRPPVSVLANEGTAKGFAFLRAFEDRAWSSTVTLDVDIF